MNSQGNYLKACLFSSVFLSKISCDVSRCHFLCLCPDSKSFNITDTLITEICLFCNPWWKYKQQWTSTVAFFALTAYALFNVLKVLKVSFFFFFFRNPLSIIFMLDRIIPSYLVQRKGTAEFMTIEPMIGPGPYIKFINNDGLPTRSGHSWVSNAWHSFTGLWCSHVVNSSFATYKVRNINKALISWCCG